MSKYKIVGFAVVALVISVAVGFFYYQPSPKPEELNGDWKGTITTTSVSGAKELTDLMDTRSLPKEEKAACKVTLDSSGNGTFIFEGMKCAASYSGGDLTFSANENFLSLNVALESRLKAGQDGSNYILEGNLTEDFKDTSQNRTAQAKGTIKLTKPIK
ncbi:MAG: hypothetical protein HPY50_19880 [Firmicutes bacterium]|nr:hypothetical protein [Bacillota bacterium]